MKAHKMFVIFRLLMVCLLFFVFASCIQTHLENKLNVKKARIQEELNSCMGKLSKKDLVMKVSAPQERVPVNNGEEIWIYKYRGTRGNSKDGHPISMDVRVNFDKNGIMNNARVTGHLGEFDTPFEDLNCANLQPAVPSGTAPAPALPAGAYQGSRNYENGDKYVGDFVQGTFNGKGIYTYANGNKYEGAFVNGKFAGEGTFTCSNGKKHQGSLEGKEPLGLKITCD